jgi:putative oxidoreductase
MKPLSAALASDALTMLARAVLGLLFVAASIDKIADPAAFAASIGNYKIVSHALALALATLLPWIELLCGLGLLAGVVRRGSSLLLFCLMVMFTIAVSSAIVRGLDISCGCFTQDPAAGKIGLTKIVENVLLIFGLVLLFFSTSEKFTLGRYLASRFLTDSN